MWLLIVIKNLWLNCDPSKRFFTAIFIDIKPSFFIDPKHSSDKWINSKSQYSSCLLLLGKLKYRNWKKKFDSCEWRKHSVSFFCLSPDESDAKMDPELIKDFFFCLFLLPVGFTRDYNIFRIKFWIINAEKMFITICMW